MPARRNIGFLLTGAALASLVLACDGARAQDGGRLRVPSGLQPSMGSPDPDAGDLLRPGLGPARRSQGGAPTSSPGGGGQTGMTPRQGLHPPKTRRSRVPAKGMISGDFRTTITPTGVAPDVQPIQTGVPDRPDLVPPPRRRPRPGAIDDPYAPLGLRVGNVVITPVIGQYLGYDSNPNRLNMDKKPSAMSQTEAEIGIQSDWSRHELSGQLRGAYSEYFANSDANRPEGAGNLRFRYDVARDTQVDLEGHYLIDTQRMSSPDLGGNAIASRPLTYTEGASLGLTQRFNRLLVTLRGTIDRNDYENARLPSGGVLDQGDRNMTQYGLRGRLGYEVHPGLIPFVEVGVDTRQYDRKFDNAGYARSSDGMMIRAGTTIELTRLLSAELSAGAARRDYQDKRLGSLTAPVADATLIYQMTPLTTIRGTMSVSIDETAVAGSTGIQYIRGTLELQHALRRNLMLTAGLRASDAAYKGVSIEEKGLGAYLRAEYRLNRNVALRASYSYDQIRSSVAGASYNANTFLLGIRLTP